MKKLLLSSLILFLVSVSAIVFQLSCSKVAEAQSTPESFKPKNRIIYFTHSGSGNFEFWSANYDGTGKAKINISIPSGLEMDGCIVSIDGTKIFYLMQQPSQNRSFIYSSNIDGTNLIKLFDSPSNSSVGLGGTY